MPVVMVVMEAEMGTPFSAELVWLLVLLGLSLIFKVD